MARARIARVHREAAWLCWHKAGRPVARCRVRLDVTLYRGRTMDEFNALACVKHVIDGLCVKALTPDDSPTWVAHGTITQQTGPDYHRAPVVVITATELMEGR